MNWKYVGPGGVETARALMIPYRRPSYPGIGWSQETVQGSFQHPWPDGGLGFARELLDKSMRAERSLIAAAWMVPEVLLDAAIAADLRGEHFSWPDCSLHFAYLYECAWCGITPHGRHFMDVAAQVGEEPDLLWLQYEWDAAAEFLLDQGYSAQIPALVGAVIDCAAKRGQARELIAQLSALGASLHDGIDLNQEAEGRPVVSRIVPPRIRKRGRE